MFAREHTPHEHITNNPTRFERAFLTKADFTEANLSEADLTGAILEEAILSEANLKQVKLTPKGHVIGAGSFLDLATAIGLESAQFSDPSFFPAYLEEAFAYAHEPSIADASKWPNFLEQVIKRLHFLRSLLEAEGDSPPPGLVEVVQTITAELIKYLKVHPKELYQLKPRQFEELIAEILASFGWEVQLTKATRDGGYDIYGIFKDDSSDLKSHWIIECKKYREDRPVGLDIVRSLYGLGLDLRVANVLLATTSYFARDALKYKASKYTLELRDYEGVVDWLNTYRSNPEGKLYIKDNRLILPGKT